jgi:hypothetical protein
MASSPPAGSLLQEPKLRFSLRERFDRVKGKLSSPQSKGNVVDPSPAVATPDTGAQAIARDQDVGKAIEPRTGPTSQDHLSPDSQLPTRDNDTGENTSQTPYEVVSAETHAPEIPEQVFKPIREVWNEAYEDLKAQDEDLITKYEVRLRHNVYGALASKALKVERAELMKSVVDMKLEQYKEDAWKVKALGEEFLVKNMAKPLVGVLKWADKYVGDALKSNPMASFGWAGVMVFVPVSFLRASSSGQLAVNQTELK